MSNRKGFTLTEVLVTIALVGILSALCGTMLIFSYSMFKKVADQGTASMEYRSFRLRAERIFRNITREGSAITMKDNLVEAKAASALDEVNCIKFDKAFYPLPFDGKVRIFNYNKIPSGSNYGTAYKISGGSDPGNWLGSVGRSVTVYSCVAAEKKDENYKRYTMLRESNESSGNFDVVLYEWDIIKDSTGKYLNLLDTHYSSSNYVKREVVLRDVEDFQVTQWLSNLYSNRIIKTPFDKTAVVRIFVRMIDKSSEYTNDLIFTNKSVYGNIDTFFVAFSSNNIVGN